MADKNAKLRLVAALIWIGIAGVLAVAAKFYILPKYQSDLAEDTGSKSRYEHEVTVAADSFSGYSIFRSPALSKSLGQRGIKLTVQDDKADYEARIKNLKNGSVDMAVFTIDSYISAAAKLGEFPGSIVLVIDETRGADAIVAYKDALGSLEDLDDPQARIVITPASPSEFLARTVIAHFSLPTLPEKWWEHADGAQDVFNRFKAAGKTEKKAYVLWEPFVSRALEIPGAHLLLDSSKLKGYIVDVLVVNRAFLRDQNELIKSVVEDYLRTAFSYSRKSRGMVELVIQDTSLAGDAFDEKQAASLVKGVEWKNTLENYAYFGLLSGTESQGHQHIEDIISNINHVLMQTGALEKDPIGGEANTLFYDKILRELQNSGFHPGKKVNIIEGLQTNLADDEAVRRGPELKELSEDEWDKLLPVGTLKIDPISFGRGSARINIQSQRDLEALAKNLDAWPEYYLKVIGNVRAEGDPEANKKLAEERAAAAMDELKKSGCEAKRIRAVAAAPGGKGGASQSVAFQLGQLPY